ncbi:MAG: FtsW/RodA/SpoVE family cell cycle protein, partial [Maricaulaceae bacterium]
MIKATFTKLYHINWLLPTMVGLIGLIGVFMIYAATGGVWSFGAKQHFFRLIIAGGLMFVVAVVDIRVWYSVAYPIYGVALLLLIGVDMFGVTINGSERWIDLGPIRLQPSELMKLGIVMALARFYHDIPNWRISHVSGLILALLMVAIPAQFILRQPDLGTTLLLTATG